MWMRWLTIAGVCLGLQIPVGAQAPEPSQAQASEKLVLVVTAKVEDLDDNHYLWGAELAAARLKGNTKVLEGGLAGALRFSRENPGAVRGIVEIMIDVYSYAEEVRITCMDAAGRQVWKEKARANMGGSEESLARKMLERALAKAEKRTACGR
jgi:hypothetical protein